MASRRDQERIRALLTEAITVLCKNGLGYNSEFCIDGLLGITVDNEDIFLVKINEKIAREKRVLHLSLEDHHSSGHGERYSVDQGSITSASPDLNSSLSQPPTPKNFNAHAPRNHHNASSEFQRGESSSLSPKASPPRKRHWDCQTPEPEPKRSHNGALSNSGPTNVVVVKEEFVNSSMEYEVIGELNGDSGVGGGAGHMSGRAWAQAATPTHPYLTNMSSNTAAGVTAYEASQVDRERHSESPGSSGSTLNPHEPLDFTLSDDKRSMLQAFSLGATAEATNAALLQHQKALLQAMSTHHSTSPAVLQWPQSHHMNPEYLRMQHKLSRPYVCEECGKTFTSSCGRRRHMDTHRGIYPYRCEHCGKGFTASNNLKAHTTLHTNINNFKCDLCGQAFRYSQYLKDHIRKEHVDLPPVRADGGEVLHTGGVSVVNFSNA